MNVKILLPMLLMGCVLAGCSKSKFLDERPDNSLVEPKTLADLQALLDNDFVMNGTGSYGLVPALGETGADNYYLNETEYTDYLAPLYRKCYTWDKDLYAGEDILDWNFPYRCIFYANIVLDALPGVQPSAGEQTQWNEEKGSALFHRGHMLYQLAQVFAPPYDSLTAATDLGVPLRMESDINEPIRRASVAETYRQMVADVSEAIGLLPVTPLYKTRPSKAAAYALLARIYQTMEDYPRSLLYADSCLQLTSALMDYNTMSTTDYFPFQRFNPEVLFSCAWLAVDLYPVAITVSQVDSGLYSLYDTDDLRRVLFFKDFGNGPSFTGTYDQEGSAFCGPATDEVMLIRAEALARAGRTEDAMTALNNLLMTRYLSGTFMPLEATDAEEALRIILRERRKELLMRGLRWTDLRRLNKDPRFAVTLTRIVNGDTYTLPPNDKRYVYPIPDKVIALHPDMKQNER
ncbi:MAG: RagB/SusD family nutrient uptake outer membrane protein [Mucilaginibacter polytrichastri]|nr:RagB/SusD family nutrient uptake outer membrane protein [Mucilaginibacter polytrichastri]